MANKYIGSDFDDFLHEEGILAEVEATAMKRVIAFQIEQEMKRRNMTKTDKELIFCLSGFHHIPQHIHPPCHHPQSQRRQHIRRTDPRNHIKIRIPVQIPGDEPRQHNHHSGRRPPHPRIRRAAVRQQPQTPNTHLVRIP